MVAGHRYPWFINGAVVDLSLWFLSYFLFCKYYAYWLRPWISWNPVFQAVELARSALSLDYIIDGRYILGYLLAVCQVVHWLVGYSNNEKIF